MSKRVLAAAAVLVAVIAAAAIAWQQTRHEPTSPQRLLSHVPVDTAFLLGAFRGVPTGATGPAWRRLAGPLATRFQQMDPSRVAEESGPAMGVAAGVARRLGRAVDSDWPPGVLGLRPGGVVAAYAVAGVPVLRWELEDRRALRDTLAQAARAADAPVRRERREALRLWRYPVAGDDMELVVAIGPHFAVATFDSPRWDDGLRERVLGLRLPPVAFDRAELDNAAAAYGLAPEMLGIVDSERLLNALAGPAPDNLGQVVDRLSADEGPVGRFLSALRQEDCRAEAAAVADYWPRSIAGVPAVDAPEGGAALRLVPELKGGNLLAGLDRLRGRMPRHRWGPGAVVALGTSMNLSALGAGFKRVEDRNASIPFSCPGFVAAQRWMDRTTRRLGESLAESAGEGVEEDATLDVQGLALVLTDLPAADGGGEPLASVQGVVSLASGQPQASWETLRSMPGVGESRRDEPNGYPRIRARSRADELLLLVGGAEAPEPVDDAGNGTDLPDDLLMLRYRDDGLPRLLDAVASWDGSADWPIRRATLLAAAQQMRRLRMDLDLRVNAVKTGILVDVTAYPAG